MSSDVYTEWGTYEDAADLDTDAHTARLTKFVDAKVAYYEASQDSYAETPGSIALDTASAALAALEQLREGFDEDVVIEFTVLLGMHHSARDYVWSTLILRAGEGDYDGEFDPSKLNDLDTLMALTHFVPPMISAEIICFVGSILARLGQTEAAIVSLMHAHQIAQTMGAMLPDAQKYNTPHLLIGLITDYSRDKDRLAEVLDEIAHTVTGDWYDRMILADAGVF
jgi:hypothetical protein